LFQKLNQDGLTVLMVTHNPDNTRYMGRTILMKDGLLCTDKAEILQLVSGSKR
jgi:putative ABC transport system ATP-binding protein